MATCNKPILELIQFDGYDVPGLIELSASVGWDYDEKEIGTVLSSGKIFGHKNAEGKIVSSAAIILYDKSIASIGMVIVNEDFRGMGLGKKATRKCIESVSKETTIMLIATEEGRPLYEKMGFHTVDYVHKSLCDNYIIGTKPMIDSDIAIEEFNEVDMDELLKLDEGAFGDKRTQFLMNRIKQSEKCLVVKDNNGTIVGYGLSIPGPINLILGPIVAPDFQIASVLIDKLSSNHQGKLRIDVPSGNDDFMRFLEESGFVNVSQPPIMVTNSVNMPFRNNTLFGIAAQIFG
ncbi:GNAT family N-acetyltransferase [Halalkalibacter akibai]|uniref:Acetyltransferase n=1 Tax=Halalkalibacter akibai (strain ATCC 43226 / DSM 21942 / CIP 109018 / JCM 9157 / 1139) TaxID=1236973 RepID=W4QXT0_HALA3|nr:GNAT family N-acetyltransferase [Halalkalibacter akibai]GAE36443.1 acetyltransferase [Halalkalibacter akibai JCM 9157]